MTALKTERITILSTPDFKAFLAAEAKKENISMAELIRQRCRQKPTESENTVLLKALLDEVREATGRAKKSLEKGLADANSALQEIGKV